MQEAAYTKRTEPMPGRSFAVAQTDKQRLVEHAIKEVQRAVTRVHGNVEHVGSNADRLLGAEAEKLADGGLVSPPSLCEGFSLMDALSELHGHLDALDRQAARFNEV